MNKLIQRQAIPFTLGRRFASQTVSVSMPSLGEGNTMATIRQWFVKVGQTVKQVRLSTQKLNFDCSMRSYARFKQTRQSAGFHLTMKEL